MNGSTRRRRGGLFSGTSHPRRRAQQQQQQQQQGQEQVKEQVKEQASEGGSVPRQEAEEQQKKPQQQKDTKAALLINLLAGKQKKSATQRSAPRQPRATETATPTSESKHATARVQSPQAPDTPPYSASTGEHIDNTDDAQVRKKAKTADIVREEPARGEEAKQSKGNSHADALTGESEPSARLRERRHDPASRENAESIHAEDADESEAAEDADGADGSNDHSKSSKRGGRSKRRWDADDSDGPRRTHRKKGSKGARRRDDDRELEDDHREDVEPEIYFPAEKGCRSIEEYKHMNRIDEGTYGVVFRVCDKFTKQVYAVKRLKMEKEKEGFPVTALREINTLLKSTHENIVGVHEIVIGSTMNDIYIVMEFVEHDLKSLLETMGQPLLQGEVKTLMMQLLRGVQHLHDNWIIHRDLKTSNLLLSHKGILKIADFGLAREFGKPLKPMTPLVVTLWYRAPELLLGALEYTTAIDMWSVGCIFAELITTEPLFPARGEIDLLKLIFELLGTPNDKIWEGYSSLPVVQKVSFTEKKGKGLRRKLGNVLTSSGFALMDALLTYDPEKRVSAQESLANAWFEESPFPVDPALFPHWPARAEGHVRRHASPSAPVAASMSKEERQLHMLIQEQKSTGFSLRF